MPREFSIYVEFGNSLEEASTAAAAAATFGLLANGGPSIRRAGVDGSVEGEDGDGPHGRSKGRRPRTDVGQLNTGRGRVMGRGARARPERTHTRRRRRCVQTRRGRRRGITPNYRQVVAWCHLLWPRRMWTEWNPGGFYGRTDG